MASAKIGSWASFSIQQPACSRSRAISALLINHKITTKNWHHFKSILINSFKKSVIYQVWTLNTLKPWRKNRICDLKFVFLQKAWIIEIRINHCTNKEQEKCQFCNHIIVHAQKFSVLNIDSVYSDLCLALHNVKSPLKAQLNLLAFPANAKWLDHTHALKRIDQHINNSIFKNAGKICPGSPE